MYIVDFYCSGDSSKLQARETFNKVDPAAFLARNEREVEVFH